MALATYNDLKASVADWLDRADLTAVIPDFILMAEARFNRTLRHPSMEVRATATTTAGSEYIALPTGFLGMREIHIQGNPTVILNQMNLGEMHRQFAVSANSKPIAFAVSGGQLALGPIPDGTYTLDMVYYQAVPALAANSTNWLLTAYPDVYLYASLLQSEGYLIDDERLPVWSAAFDRSMAEIMADVERRQYGAAPIAPRISWNP